MRGSYNAASSTVEITLLDHLVRIGVLGQIGRFRSSVGMRHQRGTSVVCRTGRGVEMGTVLNLVPRADQDACSAHDAAETDGTIIRRATPEDHLLGARLEKNRLAALQDCERILADRFPSVLLMDVDLLFDGQTIFFYFLGDVPDEFADEVERLTAELAAAYEAKVELRRFAESLTSGCGPDCGTESGGGSGGCSGCVLAGNCRN